MVKPTTNGLSWSPWQIQLWPRKLKKWRWWTDSFVNKVFCRLQKGRNFVFKKNFINNIRIHLQRRRSARRRVNLRRPSPRTPPRTRWRCPPARSRSPCRRRRHAHGPHRCPRSRSSCTPSGSWRCLRAWWETKSWALHNALRHRWRVVYPTHLWKIFSWFISEYYKIDFSAYNPLFIPLWQTWIQNVWSKRSQMSNFKRFWGQFHQFCVKGCERLKKNISPTWGWNEM